MIGLAERVLNVPDRVHPQYRGREAEFQADVLPRLSSGDQSLWSEFPGAVSENRPDDPEKTAQMFKELPTRSPGHTHVVGYDSMLLVPVQINNVDPPTLPRPNSLGIDIDAEYDLMLTQMCNAYIARWHASGYRIPVPRLSLPNQPRRGALERCRYLLNRFARTVVSGPERPPATVATT
jgi:hypothetical protein